MDADVTIGELLELLRAYYESQGMPSAEHVRRNGRHVLEFMGELPARQLDTERLEAYKAHRLAEGAKLKTIKNELGFIRASFYRATKTVRYDPQTDTRRPVLPRSALLEDWCIPRNCDVVREGFVTPEQFEKIRTELERSWEPCLADLALFAYSTGWRRNEVINLKWGWVDLAEGVIRLPAAFSKNRSGRLCPITKPVRGILHRSWQSMPSPLPAEWKEQHVFRTEEGKPIPRANLWYHWRKAVVRAGFPKITMHDLRRSFARNALKAGVPQVVAQRLTGHKTDAMFRRYAITGREDLDEAASQVASYVEEATRKPRGGAATPD